uniref:TF-B3 domain-containing protein n=1 Tax=Davidia involucrata TaxID=16924 RepID=A0A5B6YGL8_DAVIN
MGCNACNAEACAECTQKCLLIHGKKKDPSSTITSFFKVMIGDNFSEVLFLPPKFARTVSALVGQKTHLEDSSGQRWIVTLSNIDGYFAFQQGWHAFSVGHGLGVGDFIVFNYIMGSHFVVQIYGKNGCQKVNFSEENSSSRKRTRTSRDFIAKDGPCPTIDKGSMDKQGSNTSVVSGSDIEITQSQILVNDVEKEPMAAKNTSNFDNGNGTPVSRAEYIEEPFYIIDRDPRIKQGEDRSSLYDLSNFEMPVSNFAADGTNKVLTVDERSPHHANKSLRSQTEAVLVDKDPVTEVVRKWVAPSNASHVEMIEKSNGSGVGDKIIFMSGKDSGNGNTSEHLLNTSAVEPAKIGNDSVDMPNTVIKECLNAEQRSSTHSSNDRVLKYQKEGTPLVERNQNVQRKVTGISESCGFPVTIAMQNFQSVERMKVVKKEQVEMIEEMCGKVPKIINECSQSINLAAKDKVYKTVKTEPVDSVDLKSSDAVNISCLVASDGQTFLELPTCLPSISFKGRTRMERKVVLLRDPVKRLWPVLYHQKYGLKILTSGWEAFSKANNIQPGDQCVFGVENEPECIYRVSFVRK